MTPVLNDISSNCGHGLAPEILPAVISYQNGGPVR